MPPNVLCFEATIANHCDESWEAMQGSAQERHCQLCDKQVHNFAAMTAREIEKLVLSSGGKLCARITRREDGSLVTLASRPLPAKVASAAQLAISASLALGSATCAAQTGSERPSASAATAYSNPGQSRIVSEVGNVTDSDKFHEQEKATYDAVLTGSVLKPDGSGPAADAVIRLRAGNALIATAKADQLARFRIAVPPGSYDIIVRQNVLFGIRIPNAALHTGEQSLDSLKTHFYYARDDGSAYEGGTTMGIVVSKVSYSFRGAIRHPWSYLKYLARKL